MNILREMMRMSTAFFKITYSCCIMRYSTNMRISKRMRGYMRGRLLIVINIVIIILELIAFVHDCFAFGVSLFEWYTVDSNVLQLVVSIMVLFYVLNGKDIPGFVTVLHFISAVGLTVTFLIAAFVLAPEGGVEYYFLENVAPINHFIGPLLSVISILFFEKVEKLPMKIIAWPAGVTLVYGVICLALNAVNVLDGPYFFLKIHEQPMGTIILWFGIIAVLCVALAFLFYKVKWRKVRGN